MMSTCEQFPIASKGRNNGTGVLYLDTMNNVLLGIVIQIISEPPSSAGRIL
jgi:hypothetical protein